MRRIFHGSVRFGSTSTYHVTGDSHLQETEGPDHAKHGTIDRLTISKIIYRTVLARQLQYVSIALPLTQSSQGAMERQFVVAAGVPLDDRLLQKVCALRAPALGQGPSFCRMVYACLSTS